MPDSPEDARDEAARLLKDIDAVVAQCERDRQHVFGCPHDGDPMVLPAPDDCTCPWANEPCESCADRLKDASVIRALKAQLEARDQAIATLQAETIALRAHDSQKDTVTGDPYIDHVARVVALVEGPEAKQAAWLHDVLEDSELVPSDLHRAGVSDAVIEAVVLLTRTPPYDDYATYISSIAASGNQIALAVKLADLKDHLRPNCPERLRPRYEAASARLASLTRKP